MFENVKLQGISGGTLTRASSAVLWIMPPRFYSNQFKRPALYNFTQGFIEQADEAVAKWSQQTNPTGIRSMAANPMWLQGIYPSTKGHLIKTARLSGIWTFMMVVNNDNTSFGGTQRTTGENQTLYFGHFIGEPMNTVSHGRTTYNDAALMTFTHKTLVNRTRPVGTHGVYPQFQPMADVDIVNRNLVGALTAQNEHFSLLRPEDLYVATSDDYNPVIMRCESSLLEKNGDPIPLETNLAIPRNNIEKVLFAVAKARGDLANDSLSGRRSNLVIGRDAYRDQVEQNLRSNNHLVDMGLQVHKSYTLGDIMQIYNPSIPEPPPQDYQPRYTPLDQTVTSARTIFSSMMTSVVPAIMAEFMILEIAFDYDSYTGQFKLFDETPFAMVIDMPEMMKRKYVEGFIYKLVNEVLPGPVANHGHFVLQMQCSCGGVSHININFLDDYTRTSEVFEVPTILGGLNSPLVGNDEAFRHNAGQLGGLINSLVEQPRDFPPPLGNFDEVTFGRSLISYDGHENDE